MEDISYVDSPNKKLMHPHYDHRTKKLDNKDSNFTCKQFQNIRKSSTQRNIIKSFRRIGMCINNTPISILPKKNLDKVCFIIINDYTTKDKKLGVGPLNDGYLIGLEHYHLGCKIFYLHNSKINEFQILLQFFMNNTTNQLTIFYTGRDDGSENIEFNNGILSKKYIEKVISSNCNGKLKIILITDTCGTGSVFDIRRCKNTVSFFVNKLKSDQSKEHQLSHGIFTYYLCKFIKENEKGITPNDLVKKINSSIDRFNEYFICEITSKELGDEPIFTN